MLKLTPLWNMLRQKIILQFRRYRVDKLNRTNKRRPTNKLLEWLKIVLITLFRK